MNYIKYLEKLSKKEYTGQKPGLKRIKELLMYLDNPQDKFPAIHITGTNGKGSTASILHSIFFESGYCVGLYTSPHLLDFRERIRINNDFIKESEVNELFEKIISFKGMDKFTYFEIITAIAFKYFEKRKIDLLICEVGLGGEYDATNVIKNKLISIITSIDYDHTDFFGKKLEMIADEKSGIIKKNVPAVVNTGHQNIDNIISKVCLNKKTKMYLLNREFYHCYHKTDWNRNIQMFSYYGINNDYKNLSLRLLGKHQLNNASLALACIELASKKFKVTRSSIYNGLKKAYWPARFEVIKIRNLNKSSNIVLDGAHNVSGANVLSETIKNSPYFKRGITTVLSILKDKDYKNICRILSSFTKKVIIFRINSPRALKESVLVKIWKKYLKAKDISVMNDFSDFFKITDTKNNTICITGSLYGIGEAIRYLKSKGSYENLEV